MILRIAIALVACLAGGWMIFDGIHVLVRGKYFGPDKPGPWSSIFIRAGIDPFRLGPLFVVLGAAWIVALIALLAGAKWGWFGMLGIAIATMWYLPLGTVLSVICIAMLLLSRT
jgi:hypothetical protein